MPKLGKPPPLPCDLPADRRHRPNDAAVRDALIVLSAAGRCVSPMGSGFEVDGEALHELVPPRRVFTGGCRFDVGEVPPGAPVRRTSTRQSLDNESALPDWSPPPNGGWPPPIAPVSSEVRA